MSKFRTGESVVVWGGSDEEETGTIVIASDKGFYSVDLHKSGFIGAVHFDQIKSDEKTTTHYTPDSTGKDYLARCEDTFSREEMIGAYRFTLGKYVDRMGKKTGEPVEKELAKIIDYATRAKAWLERS